MFSSKLKSAAAVLLAASALAACGSSSSHAVSGSHPTYTIGVLTDLTGPGADFNDSFPAGVKAGVGVAKTDGYNIRIVQADTQTSPAGTLAAAQRLVAQDHVFAVVMSSSLGFAAAPYLLSHGVPVFG